MANRFGIRTKGLVEIDLCDSDFPTEVAVPRRLYRAILEWIRRFAALSLRAAPI